MTIDTKKLRELAEAALAGKLSAFSERMHAALTPEVVLALLDERRDLVLALEKAREERNHVGVEIRREWMGKCDALRKDAERYRWLRDTGDDTWMPLVNRDRYCTAASVDQAIDAALPSREKS